MIYTHSHVDHFGGVKGIITEEQVDVGRGPGDRPGGLPAPRDRGERVRRDGDGTPGRLHVRRRARARARRSDRRRPGPDHLDRQRHPDPADARHHPHRPDAHARRRRHRVPDDSRHRGAGRDELLLPAAPRPVRRREHLAHAAQHPHDPRRARARRARVGALPDRDDRPVGRRARRGLRVAPLADLGARAGRRVPRHAARHVPVPARPDAAA